MERSKGYIRYLRMIKRIIMITFLMISIHFFIDPIYAYESPLVVDELFEEHGSIMLIIDVKTGMIEYANQAAVDFYGYDMKQLTSMYIQDINTLSHEEVKQERKLAAVEKRNYFIFKHSLSSGEIRNVEVYSYPYEKEGRLLLFSIIQDITPRTQMQKKLNMLLWGQGVAIVVLLLVVHSRKKAINNLYEEKERLRVTLYSIGDGVITTDKDGYIIDLNKVAQELTGWQQEEAKGKPLTEVLNLINEYNRKPVKNPIEEALANGNIVALQNNTLLIAKDGTEKAIADSAAPIRDNGNNILGGVIAFQDVTEKKKAEKQIQYMNYHDALTGAYNRRFFEEELNRLDVERNLPLSIIMGDVNGLKLANDAFGHMMGDLVLQKTAQVLKACCRADDIVARWGGDEFIILLPKTKKEEAGKIVDRIKYESSKVMVDSIILSISLGFETKENSDEDITKILKNAEDYMYKQKLLESPSMKRKTINTIIRTFHENNQREEEHSKRVSEISVEIGKSMNLSEIEIKKLELIGLLHDIGKIGIRESILNKPGKLTEEEWDEIKRHPEVGYRILSSHNEMSELAECVLTHHERWDGLGYPKGIAKKEIPLEARIIMVADAYDAMICKRPYREPLSKEEAIKELEENAGTQFDPYIVKVFLEKVIAPNG